MKKIAVLAGVVALLGSAAYTFYYLFLWQWHRALFTGFAFLATEIALATAYVVRRISKIDRADQPRAADDATLRRIREAAAAHDRFAWLGERTQRTNVFIPILLSGGVVVSAIAWLVERVAGATTEPSRERELAEELGQIAFPPHGLVADQNELLAQEGPFEDDEQLRWLLVTPSPRARS